MRIFEAAPVILSAQDMLWRQRSVNLILTLSRALREKGWHPMGVWKGFVWAVGRNTEWGRKQLGQETLLEQGVRERQELQARLEGRWASKYVGDERSGKIQLLIDEDGNPTKRYPHVHVIHDEVLHSVTIQVSVARGNYPYKVILPGTASGNEVNAAIEDALVELRKY